MKLPLKQLMSFGVRSFVPAGAASEAQGPFLREQVRVRLSPRFSRRTHPEASVEAAIERSWEHFRAEAPRLFNASKFRLQDCKPQQLTLELDWGLTDYKTYLGTCCSTLAPRLLADGAALSENEDENKRFAFLSRKVGVAAVLETSDAHIALIKRSKAVGLYQNLYDTPGGHPEPSHIGLTADELKTLELPGHEHRRQALETAARDEFFRSIVNEVHEEVNVDPSQLEPPLLLGVVLQTDACTPSFSFHLKTTCSAQELRELYLAGPADKFESVQLELLRTEDLLREAGASPLEEMKLTPSAQGTLALWKQHALRTRRQMQTQKQ